MINRLSEHIAFSDEFGRQMRFIAGPRQSGKTFLAKYFLEKKGYLNLYYNWDSRIIRNTYKKENYFFQKDLYNTEKKSDYYWICFDEIHKMPKWKNILKDFFDSFHENVKFVVTGSAQLDSYRKAGDSLAGRYLMFHLFPIALFELTHKDNTFLEISPNSNQFIERILETVKYYPNEQEQLLKFSGFPEPLLRSKINFQRRWKNDYIDKLIKEDLRDITRIVALENIATLMLLLPSKIGLPLSINSLVNDIGINYTSIKNYLNALQLSYVIFSIKPYSKRVNRAIKKEVKSYFFDWTRCVSEGALFENYVAMQLVTWITLVNDLGISELDIRYVRLRDGKETDFLILKDNSPWLLIEAKLSKTPTIESHHYRISEMLGKIPLVQLIKEENIVTKETASGFYQISASRFFGNLLTK